MKRVENNTPAFTINATPMNGNSTNNESIICLMS